MGIVTVDNDILADIFDGIGIYQVPLCNGNSSNIDVDTKRIYAFGLGKGIWSINAGKIPNGMGLHFKGPDNRITYEHYEAIQFGQTDTTSNNANSKEYDENMRLNSNGNLGIGLSPNNARLQVSGSGQISGNITASNISGTSDIRYKENISTIANASDRLLKLSGVSFEWKKGHKNTYPHYGVIAQKAEKVFPELVDLTGKTKEIKHVEYNGFAGILIEAIKERQKVLNILENDLEKEQAFIDQIKADNKELKNQNVLLEKKLNKLLKRINKFNNTHSVIKEYTAVK
ncbi:MAG TPA: tail fiber domain-containing protein [Bacteroidetes bacterium]|nr:tail fiber domain-containing protein [Bacteroidota bacterium]